MNKSIDSESIFCKYKCKGETPFLSSAARRALTCLLLVLLFKANVVVGQPARSPWPMSQHDPQHTGRSLRPGPKDKVVKWTFDTGENVVLSAPGIGPDGTVYFGSYSGDLYAVGSNGKHKWTYHTGGPVGVTPAINAQGTIYVGSGDGKLYAVNQDGGLEFAFDTTGPIDSSPNIGPDGSVYFGSGNGKLFSLTRGGDVGFSVPTYGPIVYSSPAIRRDGRIVYVGSHDYRLYAVGKYGIVKWRFQTGGFIDGSPAIGDDETIHFTSWDGNVYALRPDGSLKWKYQIEDRATHSSPAIASDGTIYVGSSKGILYALSPGGELKWTCQVGFERIYSPAAIDATGTIYVCSLDGLFAINPDGGLKWELKGLRLKSTPALGSDGTLYVCTTDGKLLAIGAK